MTRTPKTVDPRTETAAIKSYLTLLEATRSPSGRRTPEFLAGLVEELPVRINEETDPLKRVLLTQQLLDAERDLAAREDHANLEAAQAEFVKYVRSYSERKGVSRAAWRSAGVPAAVLREAGV